MSGTVTVSDVDSLQITGATVTISAGLTSGDVLGFTTQNGITGNYAASTGVLTLSGASTVENYQTALRSVTYWSTSENPTATSASRTVSWQVTDANSASSVAVTITINITAVNDAPMLTSVDLLTGGIEDMDYTITYEALAAAGNESDIDNSSVLFRIGTVSSGSLTKNGVAVTPGSTLLAAGESVVWRPAVNAIEWRGFGVDAGRECERSFGSVHSHGLGWSISLIHNGSCPDLSDSCSSWAWV